MYYYKTNAGKYITEEEMIGQPWILREGGVGGPRARPMNRYDPGGLRRRAPSSGDLAAIRAQRRLKKREGERGKVRAKRNDGTGKKKSYLRGGRLKVHSGGSMKLPRHGCVFPIFWSLFFFRFGSAAAGRQWLDSGQSATRSAPPPHWGGQAART